MGHSESFEKSKREAALLASTGVWEQPSVEALPQQIQALEQAARVRAGLLSYRPYQALSQRLNGRSA